MADHCQSCNSTDVLTGTDFRTCLSCGESTPYGPHNPAVSKPRKAKPASKKG